VLLRQPRGVRLRSSAAIGALPLVLATACSMGSPAGRDVNAVATPVFTSNADAPSKKATLNVATTPMLGKVVVDKEGFTLYRFDKDTAKPPKATCNGTCALTWLPVPADDADVTIEGIDKGLVGQVQRSDDTAQLTLGGWPLYRYAADHKPGDTTGQGQSGSWFAVAPDGKKAQAGGP
jgi:predicted lipoprotein with Yx(FWY)xxD motif